MATASSGSQMASPIWGGAYSSLFLGHSAWLIHSLVMAGEICPVRQDGKQGERNLRRPCSYPTCAIRSGKLFLTKALAISGADRFPRRGGTCRLHAIFMNQLPSFGVSGGIVKHDGLSVSRRHMLSHNAFRGAVVRQDHFEQPATWLASVNAAYLGEYLDR